MPFKYIHMPSLTRRLLPHRINMFVQSNTFWYQNSFLLFDWSKCFKVNSINPATTKPILPCSGKINKTVMSWPNSILEWSVCNGDIKSNKSHNSHSASMKFVLYPATHGYQDNCASCNAIKVSCLHWSLSKEKA